MKSIAIDFKNKMMCIMTEGQKGTEHYPEADKESFISFFPDESYIDYTSFTWNFEDETLSYNSEYELAPNSIMTKDCFVPEKIVPYQGLSKRYDEFLKTAGLEEFNITMDDINEILPDGMKGLFGI